MIISKTPVRISIGGGGTDLPSYYSKFGSYFISAAINKYVYIILHEHKWRDEYILKYSKTETVTKISEINNDIIRECLKLLKINKPLEIMSASDVGGQSGLGSSGAFTVGLLNALHTLKRENVSQQQLAEEACHIAINVLKQPSGKQDEYIAAFGGFRSFNINKSGKVRVLDGFNDDFIRELGHYLYMFHTGISRESKDILGLQDKATKNKDQGVINNLHKVQDLGYEIKESLEKFNTIKFGQLMHKHWLLKRSRAKTSNGQIDKWYEIALKNGAIGGKIMGAGGGGFFLFYCDTNGRKLIGAMTKAGLRHIPFNFDYLGTKVVMDI